MKVGLLSGTFDPVHLGHIKMADISANNIGLEQVWFLPEQSPRGKQNVTPYQHRVAMLELATADNDAVSTIEIEHDVHTIETLRMLDAQGNYEIYILLGADVARNLPEWEAIEEIKQLARIVTIGRNGQAADITFEHPASSKTIREQIARGEKPENIPTKVLDYIYEHGLYQTPAAQTVAREA